MSRLEPCATCGRHVFATERACPFCGVGCARASVLSAVALGLSLSACTSHHEAKPKPTPATAEVEQPPAASPSKPKPRPDRRSKPIYGSPSGSPLE